GPDFLVWRDHDAAWPLAVRRRNRRVRVRVASRQLGTREAGDPAHEGVFDGVEDVDAEVRSVGHIQSLRCRIHPDDVRGHERVARYRNDSDEMNRRLDIRLARLRAANRTG